MSSRPGRILALLLTAAAAVLIWGALASHDDLAGVAVLLFIALYYVIALAVLLVADFVITALVRSRRAVRRAEGGET
jgi:K+-transporting ATPase A subunit